MLKINSMQKYNTPTVILTQLLQFFTCANNVLRILTPLFFWLNIQPQLLLFKTMQSFFFFRFLRTKRVVKKYPRKVWNKISSRSTFTAKATVLKQKTHIIKWTFIKNPKRCTSMKKRFKRLLKRVGFRLWAKKFFKSKRQYRLGFNFIRLLKKRIQLTQHFTGKLLFASSKKHILNKLFSIFRLTNNSCINTPLLSSRFFSITYYLRFNKKYSGLLCLTQIHCYEQWKLIHINIMKVLFFNKLRLHSKRILRLKWSINKFRSLKDQKRLRRLKWRRTRKHIYARKRFAQFYSRIGALHNERMTSFHIHNYSNARFHFYYMNFLVNLWNIRSYNWKQIT